MNLHRIATTALLGLVLALAARAADSAALISQCDEACARYDLARSQELAAQALKASPGDFEAMWRVVRGQVDLGEDAQDKGQDKQAELWFNKALAASQDLVAKHPGQSVAHYYRALALGRRALFAGGKEKVQLAQQIEKAALKALELDPRNGRAHGLIGRYYREMAHLGWVQRKAAETLFGELPKGGDEKALSHLRKATELEPAWIFGWFELGETLEVMGHTAEARKVYHKAAGMPRTDHRDPVLKAEAAKRQNG
jgi:tetratricopeptide (TPR) repeat protein